MADLQWLVPATNPFRGLGCCRRSSSLGRGDEGDVLADLRGATAGACPMVPDDSPRSWSHVGKLPGDYYEVGVYTYEDNGTGAPQKESTTCCGCRSRVCRIIALLILGAAGMLYVVLGPGPFLALRPVLIHEVLAFKDVVVEKYNCIVKARENAFGCCIYQSDTCAGEGAKTARVPAAPSSGGTTATGSGAAGPTPAQRRAEPGPAAAAARAPNHRLAFDCYIGRSSLRGGWSRAKRRWCCSHFERGCEGADGEAADGEAGAVTAGAGEGGSTDAGADAARKGCAAQCTRANATASCGSHVRHAARHRFRHEPEACTVAHRAVLGECPSCVACTLGDTGCDVPTSSRSSASKYNCKAGYTNFVLGWSRAKKAWCCEHEDRGCPSDLAGRR
mmetsp:Transcript_17047/g.34824  ORF Transcript_17047/g.34824 Transcript_17047/m.34824 type:complete len:390 (+) Transcript_17047:50-1219(+)